MAETDDVLTGEGVDAVPKYRTHVGMRGGYDLMGGLQFALLMSLGMRETTTVCDLGCGSLRAGRLLIPFLQRGHYCGIEPEQWKVEEGITHELGADMVGQRAPRFDFGVDFGIARFGQKFDIVLAQSIFSHTFRDMTTDAFRKVEPALAPHGLFVATFIEQFPVVLPRGDRARPDDGSGWRVTPSGVVYTWREIQQMLSDAGLVGRRLRWFHLRQTWFVAARGDDRKHLDEVRRRSRTRLYGDGFAGNARRRALARVRRFAPGEKEVTGG
jgi:SAM-dependent methyltransferase